MSSREERVAKNEATSREINEQIQDAHEERPPSRFLRVVCECGFATCERVVAITAEEYAQLRSEPNRYAVVREHVIPDVEQTISETDRFSVVAKREGIPTAAPTDEDPPT